MSALHEHYYGYSYDEIAAIDRTTLQKLEKADDLPFHKSVVQIAASGVEKLVEETFPDVGLTARPKAMVDWCKEREVTESYRKYITCLKSHYDWFEWSSGEPEWFDEYKYKYAKEYRLGQYQVAAE
jgi:hypothetical protein